MIGIISYPTSQLHDVSKRIYRLVDVTALDPLATYAIKAEPKIHVPVRSAEFTGSGFGESGVYLMPDKLFNRVVFSFVKTFSINCPDGVLIADRQ